MNSLASIIALALAGSGWTVDAVTDQAAVAELRRLALEGETEELRGRLVGVDVEVLDAVAEHATCAGRPEALKVLLAAGARAKAFGARAMDRMLRPKEDPLHPWDERRTATPTQILDAARKLLDAGMPPDAVLPPAASACASTLVDLLLARGAGPNAADKEGRTSLAEAMHCADDLPERLMAAGARPTNEAGGSTALHSLVKGGVEPAIFERRLKALLGAGVDVDAREHDGSTALALAVGYEDSARERVGRFLAWRTRAAYVKALLAASADPNLPDNNLSTPLARALDASRQPCVELTNAVRRGRERENGALEAKRLSLERECEAHKDLLAALLEAHADANVANRWAQPPLILAAKNDCVDCVEALKAHGVSLDRIDGKGRTLLHLIAAQSSAVPKGRERSAVETLVKAGARVDARDADGRTPYDLAVAQGMTRELGDLLAVRSKPIAESVKAASASSVLVEKGRSPRFYGPESAFDGKLSTCWCEGVAGDGIGEWLQLDLVAPAKVRAIRIVPGCAATPEVFWANNTLREVEVALGPQKRTVELAEEMRLVDVGASSMVPVSFVRFTIRRVDKDYLLAPNPVAKIPDSCIGELEVDLE